MPTFRKTLFWILILFAQLTFAQNVRFEAQSRAEQVLKGQTFEVEFTLYNARGAGFKPPSFGGCRVLSGPDVMQSSQTTYVNGNISRQQTYTYSYTLMAPAMAGKVQIGAAKVSVNGQEYSTQPITVQVMSGGGNQGGGGNGLAAIGNKVLLRAETPSQTVVPGEQVVIDYRLYSSVAYSFDQMQQLPEFKDLYAIELQQYDRFPVDRVLNGVAYSSKSMVKVALFPVKTGKISLEPAIAQIGIRMRTQENSIWGMFDEQVVPYTVATEPLNIDVVSLPEPSPNSFMGAVGALSATWSIDKQNLSTDDAFTVTLLVEGEGDLKSVRAPELRLPEDSFEVYQPKLEDKQFEQNGKICGIKKVSYVIVPLKPGTFSINPKFSWFDTRTRGYQRADTTKFTLTISPGTKTNTTGEEDYLKKDIRNAPFLGALGVAQAPFFGSAAFWGGILAAFVLWAGMLFWRRRKQGEHQQMTAKKDKELAVPRRLAQAKSYLDTQQTRPFYEEISKVLWGYASEKYQIPAAELGKSRLQAAMRDAGVPQASQDRFFSIIQSCEMAIFAGMGTSEAEIGKVYQEAMEVISFEL